MNTCPFSTIFIHCVLYTGLYAVPSHSTNDWTPACRNMCLCLSQFDPVTGSSRKIVDCSNGRIKSDRHFSLPSDTSSLNLSANDLTLSNILPVAQSLLELRSLNLSHNTIWKIGEMKKLASHLSMLDLSSNSISAIPVDWIPYKDKLTVLNFSFNKIEFIHQSAFSSMARLKYLDLSHNKIWQLHKKWFQDLVNLENLDLSHNMITSLSGKVFTRFTSLISLDLSNNRIDTIELGAFHGLIKLRHLYLNGNQISGNLTGKLEGFNKLSILDLSNNDFSSIDTHTFINVKTKRIILNREKYLKYVQREAFINMPYLSGLELSENLKLEYIDPKAFSNLPLLEKLSLSSNRLQAVFKQSISLLPSLQHLSLKGNPMICDCNVHWLLAKDNRWIVDLNDTVCQGPTLLRGRLVSQSLRQYVSPHCRPEIVPVFISTYSRVLGQPFHMECYALGNPAPDIYWIFTGNITNKLCTSNSTEMFQPFQSGISLSIKHLTIQHSGQYKCMAQNSQGRSVKCFQIDVEGNKGNIVILKSTDHSIVFTWNGTDPNNKYRILYRENVTVSDRHYNGIDISPGMRKYSLSHLNSSTVFEICIALQSDVAYLDRKCLIAATTDRKTRVDGIHSTRSLFIGLSIGGFVLFMLCVSILWISIKKYNKSQDISRYMLPQSTSRQRIVSNSDGISSVGTPTTYENKMLELSDEEGFIEESEASFPPLVT